MVLESYGHSGLEISEARLREICECDETGTSPEKVAEAAAEHFGLTQSRTVRRFTLDQLKEALAQGVWPIVYLDLLEYGTQNSHAVVVVEVTADKVYVLDPELDHPGERELSKDGFDDAWGRALSRVI